MENTNPFKNCTLGELKIFMNSFYGSYDLKSVQSKEYVSLLKQMYEVYQEKLHQQNGNNNN